MNDGDESPFWETPGLDDIWYFGGRSMYYKLIDRVAVPCTLREFIGVVNSDTRCVAFDEVKRNDSDPVKVSTVFLGMDHNHSFNGPPIVFETMVFGGPLDEHQVRYATWGEAALGHSELLAEVKTEGELTAALIKQRIDAINKRAREGEAVAAEAVRKAKD